MSSRCSTPAGAGWLALALALLPLSAAAQSRRPRVDPAASEDPMCRKENLGGFCWKAKLDIQAGALFSTERIAPAGHFKLSLTLPVAKIEPGLQVLWGAEFRRINAPFGSLEALLRLPRRYNADDSVFLDLSGGVTQSTSSTRQQRYGPSASVGASLEAAKTSSGISLSCALGVLWHDRWSLYPRVGVGAFF